MKQLLKNKLYLIFILLLSKFGASEPSSGISAPLSGCFSLKQSKYNNGQVSHFREEWGVPIGLRQYLTLFVKRLNTIGVLMNNLIFSRRKKVSSYLILDKKFSVLTLAVETAIAKISKLEGPESETARAIQIVFSDFGKEFEKFTLRSALYPENEQKIQEAARKLNHNYNGLLNSVINAINIIPTSECVL